MRSTRVSGVEKVRMSALKSWGLTIEAERGLSIPPSKSACIQFLSSKQRNWIDIPHNDDVLRQRRASYDLLDVARELADFV